MDDIEILLAACTEIESLLPSSLNPNTSDARLPVILTRLREMARHVSLKTRSIKSSTQTTKDAMDALFLDLQNLLFVQNHLEYEIDRCLQYKDTYSKIELHPLDEFLAMVSEEMDSNEMDTDQDPDYKLMMRRLKFEKAERLRLLELQQELQKEKADIAEDISKQRALIDKMDNQYDVLIKVTKSLKELADWKSNDAMHVDSPKK